MTCSDFGKSEFLPGEAIARLGSGGYFLIAVSVAQNLCAFKPRWDAQAQRTVQRSSGN